MNTTKSTISIYIVAVQPWYRKPIKANHVRGTFQKTFRKQKDALVSLQQKFLSDLSLHTSYCSIEIHFSEQ